MAPDRWCLRVVEPVRRPLGILWVHIFHSAVPEERRYNGEVTTCSWKKDGKFLLLQTMRASVFPSIYKCMQIMCTPNPASRR